MKSVFITLLLTIPVIFILSCKRESNNLYQINNSNKYTNTELIATFSTLGKLHNDGLDSIYNLLESNIILLNNMPNTNEKHMLVYSLINQSICKYIYGNLQVSGIVFEDKLYKLFNDKTLTNLYGKDIVTQVSQVKKDYLLSSTYLSLLNKIDSLININAQEQSFKNLITENIKTLDEDFEKMQFISSVSIAFNSTNYWKSNLRKWRYLLNPNYVEMKLMSADANQKTDPNKAGNDIGKADVSGIIYGAGSGCIYGAIGGTATLPGVGTITGCLGAGSVGALTGGLGNSAKTAVDKFIDWLTK